MEQVTPGDGMAQKLGSRVNRKKSHGKTIVPNGVIMVFIMAFSEETRRYLCFFGRNLVKELYSDVTNYGYVSRISQKTILKKKIAAFFCTLMKAARISVFNAIYAN